MGWPSWGELAGILTPIGLGYGWWVRRRDRASTLEAENTTLKAEKVELEKALEQATTVAEKTRRTQAQAIHELKQEIAEWRRQVERRDDRIDVLEDRLYTKGGTK